MANSTDPDQMPHLVWVYIVGQGLSVSILRVIMVMFHTPQPVTQNDWTDQYIMGYVKQNGAFEHSQNAQIEFIYSVVAKVPVSGQWRPWSDDLEVQNDLGIVCPDMFKEVFTRHGHIANWPDSPLHSVADLDGKQCRSRSVAECGIWSMSSLFSTHPAVVRHTKATIVKLTHSNIRSMARMYVFKYFGKI